MDNKTEVIKSQMEETRAALTDKLETLENQVVDTVQGATSVVSDTVENVKETVENVRESVGDAVEAVKGTFDLRRQVERYPWAMMGGSVAVGFIAGRILDRVTHASHSRAERHMAPSLSTASTENGGSRPYTSEGLVGRRAYQGPEASSERGWVQSFAEHFAPELTKLKGLAIGTALGVFRDLVKPLLPEQLGEKVHGLVDDMTQKLGGEPISGNLMPQADDKSSESERQPNGFNQPQGAGYSAGRSSSEGPPFNRR